MAHLKARYLVDKSALARLHLPAVDERLGPLLARGEAATCAMIELEILYSARSLLDYDAISQRRRLAYPWVPITEATFELALASQRRLATTGHHRVPIPDLLIAACAAQAGLTVLHYDGDFDIIATATGQPCEWVVARGSV